MKELVEVIAKALVDHPEGVVVTETVTAEIHCSGTQSGSGRHGQSHRQTGTDCESDSYRCKIRCIKG